MKSSSLWPGCSMSFGRLDRDLEAEIVIVGAGVAGLTIAHCLKHKGFNPIIIDAGQPGMGETHLTTAHLASVIDDRFLNIEKWHGEKGSQTAYQSHAAAISFIETLSKELNIDCNFKRVPAYLFATDEKQKEELKKELDASRRAGHLQAEWMDQTPLSGLEKYPCIYYPDQAQFNPGEYINGLLKILQNEIRIFTHERLLSWEQKDKVILKTENHHTITCDKVIFATNDPYVRLTYYTLHAPYRSYAIAFSLEDSRSPDSLFWDNNDPYHYIRFAEWNGERVLIVGGEDHRTGQKDNTRKCWDNLEKWSRNKFPFIKDRITQWSGQILETMDGLGFIGADPKTDEKVFLVSGDSGMGLTHGTIAGLLIADLISKEHQLDEWAKLYHPLRFKVGAAKEFFQEAIKTTAPYLNHFCTHLSDHPEDEGKVYQKGLCKVAEVKTDGVTSKLTAICPHLGGLVVWNNAEQTWDCQLHGSRFDKNGKVLNGPAVTPLERKEP